MVGTIINDQNTLETMKKIVLYISLLCIAAFFYACESDDTENVSEITNYASIVLIGDSEIIINQNDPFTDPGADVTIAGEPVPYETSTIVDSSVPGVYFINYSATNEDGFTATGSRTVVVVSTEPSMFNLAGNWARSNGSPGTLTQLSDREYMYDNAGGVTGENQLTIKFINVNDKQIWIPFQENASPSGLSVRSFQPGNIEDNDHFSWTLSASGFYGTFERFFIRQ